MLKLDVPDMSCGHCLATITRALQAADPDAKIVPSLRSRQLDVESTLGADEVVACLREAGYPATARA